MIEWVSCRSTVSDNGCTPDSRHQYDMGNQEELECDMADRPEGQDRAEGESSNTDSAGLHPAMLEGKLLGQSASIIQRLFVARVEGTLARF